MEIIIGIILLIALAFLMGYYFRQYLGQLEVLQIRKTLIELYEADLRRCGHFIYENADYIKELIDFMKELKDILEDDSE